MPKYPLAETVAALDHALQCVSFLSDGTSHQAVPVLEALLADLRGQLASAAGERRIAVRDGGSGPLVEEDPHA